MKILVQAAALVLSVFSLTGHSGTNNELAAQVSTRCNTDCNQFQIDAKASDPLSPVTIPPARSCHTGMSNGYSIPDPNCTPGAINPIVTMDVLRNPSFRACCIRQGATTELQKPQTYQWYGLPHPSNNSGQTQTCELDHLVSLELCGEDTLDNIWPQCGPPNVELRQRYFKQKDEVENYLAKQVKEGRMDLSEAQKGLATDWTHYLTAVTGQ